MKSSKVKTYIIDNFFKGLITNLSSLNIPKEAVSSMSAGFVDTKGITGKFSFMRIPDIPNLNKIGVLGIVVTNGKTDDLNFPAKKGFVNVFYVDKLLTLINDGNSYIWRTDTRFYNPKAINVYDDNIYFLTQNTPFKKLTNASWSARTGHSSVVFLTRIWVIGGRDASGVKNDVWYSFDGISWIQATTSAPWQAREGHSSVVFDGRIWVIGGRNSSGVCLNDVWYSYDGETWVNVGSSGFTPRVGHTSVVYDNKIWVIGGYDGSGNYLNDVWYSSDGINWFYHSSITNRAWHSTVVFGGKIYVIGGYYGSGYRNDILVFDGYSWRIIDELPFSPRSKHSSVVFDNKIWIIGGFYGHELEDVWYSEDGTSWYQDMRYTSPLTDFFTRSGHTSVVFDGKMWVLGGSRADTGRTNDVLYAADKYTMCVKLYNIVPNVSNLVFDYLNDLESTSIQSMLASGIVSIEFFKGFMFIFTKKYILWSDFNNFENWTTNLAGNKSIEDEEIIDTFVFFDSLYIITNKRILRLNFVGYPTIWNIDTILNFDKKYIDFEIVNNNVYIALKGLDNNIYLYNFDGSKLNLINYTVLGECANLDKMFSDEYGYLHLVDTQSGRSYSAVLTYNPYLDNFSLNIYSGIINFKNRCLLLKYVNPIKIYNVSDNTERIKWFCYIDDSGYISEFIKNSYGEVNFTTKMLDFDEPFLVKRLNKVEIDGDWSGELVCTVNGFSAVVDNVRKIALFRGVISKTFSVSISGSNVYRITRLKFYYTEEGTI